jgi:hypothetical protein
VPRGDTSDAIGEPVEVQAAARDPPNTTRCGCLLAQTKSGPLGRGSIVRVRVTFDLDEARLAPVSPR